jgi:2-iminoacetate synthase
MTFSTLFKPENIAEQVKNSLAITPQDVKTVLGKSTFSMADFVVLISPAAKPFLETLAQKSHTLTVQRFGKVMQLFIPMYLANVCYNNCAYCGFSMSNTYERIVLTPEEILKEALFLKEKGFQHLLLLTGEADKSSVGYIADAVKQLHPHFSSIGIEIQPLSEEDYGLMIRSGSDSLTVYQETYDPVAYAKYHTLGKKRNFTYRLDTPDRGGKAGFYKMNIGALMGLSDWRFEAFSLAQHLTYLQKTYWQTKYSVSFPRIRDMVGEFTPAYDVTDSDLVQLICAFRLVFPDLGITLSTRESAALRDSLIKLGVTMISAESNTAPGGYLGKDHTEKQFETSDHRSLAEIKALLMLNGYEPVLKDWDRSFVR